MAKTRGKVYCANCSKRIRGLGYMVFSDGSMAFCGHCSGIAEALGIGSCVPAFLYERKNGEVVAWAGAVMGRVVRRTVPGVRFGAVRVRVRMLDGSAWWGSGPITNGNYLRLRPMKGARHG